MFPWTSSIACTQAFLSQARADAVKGAIAFQPNLTSPPAPIDSSWSLQDASLWKSDNQFPIYGIGSDRASQIYYEMTLYTGNMSQAPNGDLLVEQYDPRDFPRIFAHIDLQGGANVPSLWIFLIIVLAVLLGIVIVASVVMHLFQRHQRRVLQRRLERGEVDLETLGIKKMNVPQHKIDEMPKFIYTEALEVPVTAAVKLGNHPPTQGQAASFSQSTCPICLDDFVSNETQVRELPCKHIFHPECIDLFLRDNSSLCPMCKASALPPGYCPVKVTNLMVRRERLVRRMRERRAIAAARAAGLPPPGLSSRARAWMWMQRKLRVGEGVPSQPASYLAQSDPARQFGTAEEVAPNNPNALNNDVELGPTASANSSTLPDRRQSLNFINARRQTIAVPADVAAQGPAARRAWRRERLARQQEAQYNQQAENTRQADVGRPLWRRAASRIVPGFD